MRSQRGVRVKLPVTVTVQFSKIEMHLGSFQLDRRLPELATEEKVIEEPVLICDTHALPQLMPAEALVILPREEDSTVTVDFTGFAMSGEEEGFEAK